MQNETKARNCNEIFLTLTGLLFLNVKYNSLFSSNPSEPKSSSLLLCWNDICKTEKGFKGGPYINSKANCSNIDNSNIQGCENSRFR